MIVPKSFSFLAQHKKSPSVKKECEQDGIGKSSVMKSSLNFFLPKKDKPRNYQKIKGRSFEYNY